MRWASLSRAASEADGRGGGAGMLAEIGCAGGGAGAAGGGARALGTPVETGSPGVCGAKATGGVGTAGRAAATLTGVMTGPPGVMGAVGLSLIHI